MLVSAAGARAADIPATFTQLGYLYYPEGVSSGGKVVVGNLYNDNPFIIGGSNAGLPSAVYGVSADGKTFVGMDAGAQPVGARQTPDLNNGSTYAVSASGKQMAGLANAALPNGGYSLTAPFVWTEAGGFAWLPVLPGTVGDEYVKSNGKVKIEAMSPDGQKIVGYNDGTPVLWKSAATPTPLPR